jgi:hypothetical protein
MSRLTKYRMLDFLESAFLLLIDAQLVRTQTEFSCLWLGQSESDFAFLRSSKANPSLECIAHLGNRLIDAANAIAHQQNITPGQRRLREAIFRVGMRLSAEVFAEALRRQRIRRNQVCK